jgi:hypothetical protein
LAYKPAIYSVNVAIITHKISALRRRQSLARLATPRPVSVAVDATTIRDPDFVSHARKVWGERPSSKALSELVSETRG